MNNIDMLVLDMKNLGFTDLNPENFGMEECRTTHYWGPGARSNYHLHFIVDGEGHFSNSSGDYYLGKGQGFLFIPGEKVFYEANPENPWNYVWIGFSGEKAALLLEQAELKQSSPVFEYDKSFDILTYFAQAQYMKLGREIFALSVLYSFFSSIIKHKDSARKSKVDIAINYILQNLSSNIKVERIAKHLNIDRRYLSRLFYIKMGISPQQYIINSRMTLALELLKEDNDLNIGDVAHSVGYSDPLAFSKMFKKTYNLTPKDIINGIYPPADGTVKH